MTRMDIRGKSQERSSGEPCRSTKIQCLRGTFLWEVSVLKGRHGKCAARPASGSAVRSGILFLIMFALMFLGNFGRVLLYRAEHFLGYSSWTASGFRVWIAPPDRSCRVVDDSLAYSELRRRHLFRKRKDGLMLMMITHDRWHDNLGKRHKNGLTGYWNFCPLEYIVRCYCFRSSYKTRLG